MVLSDLCNEFVHVPTTLSLLFFVSKYHKHRHRMLRLLDQRLPQQLLTLVSGMLINALDRLLPQLISGFCVCFHDDTPSEEVRTHRREK